MYMLINTVSDWKDYRESFCGGMKTPVDRVDWGEGPREYPCLVSTFISDTDGRLVARSAYVYCYDARRLLQAILDREQASQAAETQKATTDDNVIGAAQRDYNRWASAHLLAIVSFLLDAKIMEEGDYEGRLLNMLDLVDRSRKQDAETVVAMSKLRDAERMVVDSLDGLGGLR